MGHRLHEAGNKLVVCEIHNPSIHGETETSSFGISGHFLCLHTTSCDKLTRISRDHTGTTNFKHLKHPVIRNYFSIISRRGMRTFEIAQLFILPGEECVCILKTFWLRIFQRHIKKWIQNKRRVSDIVKNSRFFIFRECGKYGKYLKSSR
jgi:hypothetical protein